MNLTGILMNPVLYLVLLAMAVSGVGMRYLRRVNLNKSRIYLIAVIGLLFAWGIVSLSTFGIGSTAFSASSIDISRIQTTTAFHVDNDTTGVDLADVGVDDTRMSDFYIDEPTANADPIIEAGIFQVTREGKLDANSCPVSVIKPPRYDISDTTYHIVNEDADTGVMTAYVRATSDSGVATTSHPKETSSLPFAEGVSVGYVSFLIEIDETGFDPLSQYDKKDINVDICGYPYTFRLHKSDA